MRKSLLFSMLFVFSFLTSFCQKNYVAVTYAGSNAGLAGFANRADTFALFNSPTAIAVDSAGNSYVADTYNNAIREILVTNDSVITLAGDTAGYTKGSDSTAGYVNGYGANARFNKPLGICVDKAGKYVYVADTYNNVIRKIWVAKDSVSTLTGNSALGYRNGKADSAEFNRPIGLALDTAGNLFVADDGNNVIREVWLTKSDSVSTFAGNDSLVELGYLNGKSDTALFFGLYGIAINDSNTMYVTEYMNDDIRMIKNGMVSKLAGGYDTVRINDTLHSYNTGYLNGSIDSAEFNNPTGIAVDDSGDIYVVDEYNQVIRKIYHGMVSTFAGNHIAGFVNGPDSLVAEFNDPMGIALDRYGRFYVADNANNVIRRLYSSNVLGIAPLVSEKLSMVVYPNPCTNSLTIAAAPKGKAELLDITGRIVWQDEQFKAPYSISTEGISPGMYFLKVCTATQSAVQKVIVQH
jgi:DNA-binding beta-propeller fold protein YncE